MAATSETDQLFSLPLTDFTTARNALAARLKQDGRPEDAARVRALAKPSIPAWAVNQLYWRHRTEFDRLMTAGTRVRTAQVRELAGRDARLRELLDARRTALEHLLDVAGDVLRAAGHAATAETMRRISTTLDALATYGTDSDTARAGRLTQELAPPGFDALASLVATGAAPGAGASSSRVIPFGRARAASAPSPAGGEARDPRQREKARAEARAAAGKALQEAQRALGEARAQAVKAQAALKKAAAQAKETERTRADLEQRLEKATEAATEARHTARRLATDAEQAAQNVDDAERALDAARRALAELT